MKIAVILAVLLAGSAVFYASSSEPRYPQQVWIIQENSRVTDGVMDEGGFANIGSMGHAKRGFSFIVKGCPRELPKTDVSANYYPARYDPGSVYLTLSVPQSSGLGTVECNLRVTFQNIIYEIDEKGRLVEKPLPPQ
jgi:hypothetical protein